MPSETSADFQWVTRDYIPEDSPIHRSHFTPVYKFNIEYNNITKITKWK
jgi:hypothetical protein